MNISEKAMLVALSISAWSGRKYDKDATAEVAQNHGTDASRAGRFNKILVNPISLKDITSIAGNARNYTMSVTLPWLNDGIRIIPVDIYLEYVQRMSEYRSQFNQAVEKLLVEYDALVKQARLDLNGLFKESDYPSAESIRRKHAFNVRVFNLPDSNDFRVSLSESEFQSTKQEIEQNLSEAQDNAVRDVFQRVSMRMEHMLKRLKEVEANDGKGIRESMMSNISDLADILPKLNITNNPDIDGIAMQIKHDLATITSDDLRENQSSRIAAAQTARDILNKVSAYI
jgi:hypothetical protein